MLNKNATIRLDELPPVTTVTEAATIARVCPKYMRELLRGGTVKGVKVGTVWKVNTADLLRYLGIDGGVIA